MYGIAWVTCASQEIPAIRMATIVPCVARICRACRPSGGRSALTALDTASIPVSDDPPLANAFAMTYTAPMAISPECEPMPTAPAPGTIRGRPLVSSRTRPAAIMTSTEPANR